MRYNIRGENIEITPAIREYVEKKIGKLERHFEGAPDANVNVNLRTYSDKSGKIEVTIPLPSLILRAEEANADLYAAIDIVTDKLERQLRKHKTKVNRKFREKAVVAAAPASEPIFAEAYEDDEDYDIELVRTKRFDIKPMDSEEAILQMNLLGHSFYVFTNSDSNRMNVVYKRKDGRYGLIEPS